MFLSVWIDDGDGEYEILLNYTDPEGVIVETPVPEFTYK